MADDAADFADQLKRFVDGGNTVVGRPAVVAGTCSVEFGGSGSVLVFGEECELREATFRLRNGGGRIELGSRTRIAGVIAAERGTRIEIGDDTKMNNRMAWLLARDGAELLIGRACLLADAHIRTCDGHSILDAETGRRLNAARPVRVSDRVWIANGAMILKGVDIGSDAVVAARSVVTKSVPEGCIVAGNPARVVKRGIRWDRRRLGSGSAPAPVADAPRLSKGRWSRGLLRRLKDRFRSR